MKKTEQVSDEDSKDGDREKTSDALICMLGLGVGEILGSMLFGKITDKCKFRSSILLNIVALTFGYASLIMYTAKYEFTFTMAFTMTFFWGLQDAAINCFLSSFLGFQFASKTTPFSVYRFLQSLMIFVVACICSATDDQTSYLAFFSASYAFSLVAWLILLFCFKLLTVE